MVERGKMKRVIAILIATIILSSSMVVTAKDNDTYIKHQYQEYCKIIGKQYNVCPELLMAIIETESSGKANAKNYGCIGLMQVYEKYHKDRMERLGVTDLTNPYQNILVGTDYLMELAEKYEDLGLVLMKYNGDSKANAYWETGELSEYAAGIIERSAELERIRGK